MFLKSNFLFILLIIFIAAGLIATGMIFGYLFMRSKIEPATVKPSNIESVVEVSEEMTIGEVGEITVKDEETGEDKSLVTPTMPQTIFSTAGEIKEIGKDFIIIAGDGYSFADEAYRDVKCLITEQTKIFSPEQADVYYGKDGLKHLSIGTKILVGSPINIRGKIEFEVNTVNVLE